MPTQDEGTLVDSPLPLTIVRIAAKPSSLHDQFPNPIVPLAALILALNGVFQR